MARNEDWTLRFADIDFDERGLMVTRASLMSIIETEEIAQDPKLTESQELPIEGITCSSVGLFTIS